MILCNPCKKSSVQTSGQVLSILYFSTLSLWTEKIMICGAPSQQDMSGERRKIGTMMWIKWLDLELKKRWDGGDNDVSIQRGL